MQRCKNADTSDSGGSCRADDTEGVGAGSNKRSRIFTETPISYTVPFVSIKITSLQRRTITIPYVEVQVCYSISMQYKLLVGPQSSPLQLSTLKGLKNRDISFWQKYVRITIVDKMEADYSQKHF